MNNLTLRPYPIPPLISDSLMSMKRDVIQCMKKTKDLKGFNRINAFLTDTLERLNDLINGCIACFITSKGHGELSVSELPQMMVTLECLRTSHERYLKLDEEIRNMKLSERKMKMKCQREKLFSTYNRYERLHAKVELIQKYVKLRDDLNGSRSKWLRLILDNTPRELEVICSGL